MTLKENVIRETGKYSINVYIKQVWEDSLPTPAASCKYTNLALQAFWFCMELVVQELIRFMQVFREAAHCRPFCSHCTLQPKSWFLV